MCDNCGKKEANVRYWENINGKKRELNLCDECSKKLGIGQIDFSMPIGISSFLGGFMEDFQTKEFMPMLNELKTLKCNSCGYTFDDIINTGRLGCKNCYDIFQDRLDPIIKKIQGDNRHVGRIGKIIDSKIDNINDDKEESMKKDIKNGGNSKEDNKELSKIEKLQEELKKAIAEEKYEEAAKIIDEIKKLES